LTKTVRLLVTAGVAAVVVVAVLLMVPRRPASAQRLSAAVLSDSIRIYKSRLVRLSEAHDSLKLTLAREDADSMSGARYRIGQVDSLLTLAESSFQRVLLARDADSRWHAYRNFQYYFGVSEVACCSLAKDTIHLPPEPTRFPWQP
jgi:hypothetical protein